MQKYMAANNVRIDFKYALLIFLNRPNKETIIYSQTQVFGWIMSVTVNEQSAI